MGWEGLAEERNPCTERQASTLFPPPAAPKLTTLLPFSPMNRDRKTAQKSQNSKEGVEGERGLEMGTQQPEDHSQRRCEFPSWAGRRASTMSSLREVKGLPRSFCGSNTELIA